MHKRRRNTERNIILSGLVSKVEYRAVKVSGAPLMERLRHARLLRLRYKRKGIMLFVLILLVSIIQFVFPHWLALASFYNSYIFRPFQSLRNVIFGAIPFSVGDFLYLLGFFILVAIVVRWIYLIIRIRTQHHELAHSFINSIISLGTLYLLFFVGWGGNYYKPTLSKLWNLPVSLEPTRSSIIAYDSFLIQRLNALAPNYRSLSFTETNRKAKEFYHTLADSRTRLAGMKAKASLYGYFMQYLGIHGYYNPFTGEAQVNNLLPGFMLPFVICHEMAHQSGIAAEDDANLLSYAICTVSPDTAFAYSGYFNLWLYTQSRLRSLDSSAAKTFMAQLNPLSKQQLDTLRALRSKYKSGLSEYSGQLYDSYLRLHHQKDGISSYDNVAVTAWTWEQSKKTKGILIKIP